MKTHPDILCSFPHFLQIFGNVLVVSEQALHFNTMPQFSLSETRPTSGNIQTEVEFSKQPQQYFGDPGESMLCKLWNDANYPVSLLCSHVTLMIELRSALSLKEVFLNSLIALQGFNDRQISPRISWNSLCARSGTS